MPVYEGNEKYIFASYAHDSSALVLPIIEGMQKRGYRVWYDEGIELGDEWAETVERRLLDCTRFVLFLSRAAIDSENCRDEINLARETHKDILVVYVEEIHETELKHGLRLRLRSYQALFRHKFASVELLLEKLDRTPLLQDCKGSADSAISPRPEPMIPLRDPLELPEEPIRAVPTESIDPALRRFLTAPKLAAMESPLATVVGLSLDDPVAVDLARMPHLLIGGEAGTGREICLRTMLLTVAFRSSPEDVRFLIIDPEPSELEPLSVLPHLRVPMIRDFSEAVLALRTLQSEIDSRFALFGRFGVRDLRAYRLAAAENPRMPRLPYVVTVLNGYQHLARAAKEAPKTEGKVDFEWLLVSILQRARAAGIHVILSTESASVDVLPGTVRANCPSRIAFRTETPFELRSLLDSLVVDQLTRRDGMYFQPIGAQRPALLYLAFATEEASKRAAATIAAYDAGVKPDERFLGSLTFTKREAAGEDPETVFGDPDVNTVLTYAYGSEGVTVDTISHVLGNSQKAAAALAKRMELLGILGPAVPGKPRPILIGEREAAARDPLSRSALKLAVESGVISSDLLQRNLQVGFGKAGALIERLERLGYVSRAEGYAPRTVYATMEDYRTLCVSAPTESQKGKAGSTLRLPDENDLPLLDEAIELACTMNGLTLAALQRRLGIGYTRAAKLAERMHELGYISGVNGSKPRTLYLTPDDRMVLQRFFRGKL